MINSLSGNLYGGSSGGGNCIGGNVSLDRDTRLAAQGSIQDGNTTVLDSAPLALVPILLSL